MLYVILCASLAISDVKTLTHATHGGHAAQAAGNRQQTRGQTKISLCTHPATKKKALVRPGKTTKNGAKLRAWP